MVKGIFRQSKTFFAISSFLLVWPNSSKVRQERLVTSFFFLTWPFCCEAKVIRGPLLPSPHFSSYLFIATASNLFSSWDKETKPVLPFFLPSFLPSLPSKYKPFSQSSHSLHISSFVLTVLIRETKQLNDHISDERQNARNTRWKRMNNIFPAFFPVLSLKAKGF